MVFLDRFWWFLDIFLFVIREKRPQSGSIRPCLQGAEEPLLDPFGVSFYTILPKMAKNSGFRAKNDPQNRFFGQNWKNPRGSPGKLKKSHFLKPYCFPFFRFFSESYRILVVLDRFCHFRPFLTDFDIFLLYFDYFSTQTNRKYVVIWRPTTAEPLDMLSCVVHCAM